jgi:thymidylate synthase (FAD)
MILVKPSTEIITDEVTISGMLKRIEKAGRTCYKSEDKITDESAETFIKKIIKLGHETVLEHESMSVRFICDRGVSHEIVRHRIASYSQESTRYVNYGNSDIKFIIPGDFEFEQNDIALLKDIEAHYNFCLQNGRSPQQARYFLPNGLKTEIVMTANLREWRHFFKLRCAAGAHPQMREVAIPLLEKFQKLIPVIFDDL